MAKKEANRATKVAGAPATSLTSIIAGKASVDPALDSLFASSSGPVKKPSKKPLPPPSPEPEVDDEDLSEASENVSVADEEDEESVDVEMEDHEAARSKKRKRKNDDEELEDVYLRKLARLEEKEASERKAEKSAQAQPATATSPESDDSDEDEEGDEDDEEGSESTNEEEEDDEDGTDGTDSADNDAETSDFEIPQHETLAPSRDEVELDKAARTVFLGNVSTEAITSKTAKKTLMQHLASFIPSLPADKAVHKVESLRFRSTPYASAIPKKAAFAKKELMDATTKSTNAYAVYSTQLAAKEAAKRLNGTVVLNRHLRVDLVAHPAKVDHRRCVFVGNLGFVDDEMSIQSANEEDGKKKKNKTPGDVEEGLWQQFSKAGPVESVRVVRDAKTRVGKGFAYVQFKDENGVEAALLFNDKKFPPLLPRTLRVVRAKAIKRKDIKKKEAGGKGTDGVYKPKPDARRLSYLGRAGKLLGRAGAAQARSDGGFKKPEEIIFEGHRASAAQGKAGFKFNKSKKKGGKPQNRSSKRAAAWKAAGGKKKA